MASNDGIRAFTAGGVVRTAIWSLAPVMAACPSDDAQVDDGGDEDSTSAGDGAEASMTAADDDTTLDGEDAETTTVDGADDDTTTTTDGADSTTTDEGASDDTLVDGCWDREFEMDYYAVAGAPDWEPFACALPELCETLYVDFTGRTKMTPDEIAQADASARCILEALRDGTPAVLEASTLQVSGTFSYEVRYHVLSAGVVGWLRYEEDLGGGQREAYRAPRDAAFFEACLAETELEALVGCIVPAVDTVAQGFPPLDEDACIDDVPQCPD